MNSQWSEEEKETSAAPDHSILKIGDATEKYVAGINTIVAEIRDRAAFESGLQTGGTLDDVHNSSKERGGNPNKSMLSRWVHFCDIRANPPKLISKLT